MKKKMLKLISVALAMVLAVGSLSACGDMDEMLGEEPIKGNSSVDSAPQTPEVPETTVAPEAPEVLQFFEMLQDNESIPFTITEKAKVMLSENDGLFRENKNEGLEQYTDTDLTYKVLTKNIEKHGDKLIYLPEAYVLSIDETNLDAETVITELHLLDTDGNSFYALSPCAYEDIYEEDTVSIYALPIGETSFENIGGGTTLAIMLAGCYVEEIQ